MKTKFLLFFVSCFFVDAVAGQNNEDKDYKVTYNCSRK